MRKKWTTEMLQEEALKYIYKKDFIANSSCAYAISCKRKLIDKICKHMIPLNTLAEKDIYFLVCDKNKAIYVGISINPQKRYIEHCNRGTENVKNIIIEKHRLLIVEKNLSLVDAVKREAFWIRFFTKKNWNIANQNKAGSIGLHLNLKWNKDKVLELAKNHIGTITQFKTTYPGAYNHALTNKYREMLFDKNKSLNRPTEIIFFNEKVLLNDLVNKYNISKSVLYARYKRGDRDLRLLRSVRQSIIE